MTTTYESLSSEISRIIKCPYPASLRGLADLLTRAGPTTTQACIDDQTPCAIRRLAILICDALPLCPYTLDVLHNLCHASEFRNELLLTNAGFLDSMLLKTVNSQSHYDKHAKFCVLLLSQPLPETVPLPASAQLFFIRVFNDATQDPTIDALRSIYHMLNGACRNVLGALSIAEQQDFDQQLCNLLASNSAAQNTMLLLWCFGVVALAETLQHEGGSSSSTKAVVRTRAATQCKASSSQKLFGSTKGSHKTITLACMSIVWALKTRPDTSDDEAVEGMQVAAKTVQFISPHARDTWRKSSSLAESTFQKLCEKIKLPDASDSARLVAMDFYALVVGDTKIKPHVATIYGECLLRMTQNMQTDQVYQSLVPSVTAFASQLPVSTCETLLVRILDSCIKPTLAREMSSLNVLVETISCSLPDSDILRLKLQQALSTNFVESKLQAFLQSSPLISGAECKTCKLLVHHKFVSATTALLLNLALVVQSGSATLPYATTIDLIKKQQNSPSLPSTCPHTFQVTKCQPLAIFQQESTPYTGHHLQDWKNRLESELDRQSRYQRDLIVRSVTQICQDLELRCETVEEPLRLEREKSDELAQLVSQLQAQTRLLKTERMDDRYHLEGIEKEKEGLVATNHDLSASVEVLKSKLAEAKMNEDKVVKRLQQELETKQLQLQSAISQLAESERTYNAHLQERTIICDSLAVDNQTLLRNFNELRQQAEVTCVKLAGLKDDLEREQDKFSRQADEIKQLRGDCVSLRSQLKSTEADLETTTGKLSNSEATYHAHVQHARETLHGVELNHQSELETAAGKAEDARNALQAKIDNMLEDRQTLQDSYDRTHQDLQVAKTSIPPLKNKIQELTCTCTEQNNELDELRTIRRNVLTSMGLGTPKPRSGSTASTETHSTKWPRPQAQSRRRKPSEANRENKPATHDPQLSESSRSSPKRVKSQQSFDPPSMLPHTISRAPQPTTSSPTKHAALSPISDNRRRGSIASCTVGKKEADKVLGMSSSHADEDDFDGMRNSSFVTGTGRFGEEEEGTTEL